MSGTRDQNSMATTSPAKETTSQFKEILKSNGITDPILEVIVNDTGLKGENFGGVTKYVTVKFADPEKRPLHLFVKKKTENPEFNKILDEFQSYQKEFVFLMEYLPKAREYCKLMGHEELMDIYPKSYYADEKMVVLENLVVGRGFTLLDKEEQQDFETAKIALSTLAKHHAISHALIKELGGPERFFELFPNLRFEVFFTDTIQKSFCPNFEKAIDTNIKILEKCEVPGRDEAVEKLCSWKGKSISQVIQSLKIDPDDFLVLNHGDYWNNNMMFIKDKKSDKVLDHVVVDFQIMRYASPSVDLGFYLFTSVKPKVRREHLRNLLQVYLDTLKEVGDKLGHPVDISLKKLEADFCQHFQYGYWTAMKLTTGPGLEVLKDIDIEKTLDIASMVDMFDRLVLKWINEHPEECKKKAHNIIEYVREHERLSNGVIDYN